MCRTEWSYHQGNHDMEKSRYRLHVWTVWLQKTIEHQRILSERSWYHCPCDNAGYQKISKATGLYYKPCQIHSICYHHKSPTIYFVSVSSASPNWAAFLAWFLSTFLSRAALVFARLASISSLRSLSRAFSALALWIYCNLLVWCFQLASKNQYDTYVFDQCTLVLESVTLAQVVKFVVKVFVDLAAGTVLD